MTNNPWMGPQPNNSKSPSSIRTRFESSKGFIKILFAVSLVVYILITAYEYFTTGYLSLPFFGYLIIPPDGLPPKVGMVALGIALDNSTAKCAYFRDTKMNGTSLYCYLKDGTGWVKALSRGFGKDGSVRIEW